MDKKIIILVSGVCGSIGGYVPILLGAGSFSGWSLIGAFIGGLVGIWIGVKLADF